MIHLQFNTFSEKQMMQLVNFIVSDQTANNSHCLEEIFGYLVQVDKYHSIIKYILDYGNIQLDRYQNDIIIDAARYNRLALAKILLNDKRLDPSICHNEALITATEYDHLQMVKLLLTDVRVDPSDQADRSLILASTNGNYEIVRMLMEDERVNPANSDNSAIQIASEKGFVDIVRLLLTDHRVDPSVRLNYPITYAAANGHLDVVKLLLTDSRVDPSAYDNFSITEAFRLGHIEVVKLLLSKININEINDNRILKLAIETGSGREIFDTILTTDDTHTFVLDPLSSKKYNLEGIVDLRHLAYVMIKHHVSTMSIDPNTMIVRYS